MNRYKVNEIFCSPQGEGARQGQLSVFVRFTGCNLRCQIAPGPRSPGGFDCDTEFMSGRWMAADEIIREAASLWRETSAPVSDEPWIVFTGGEPMLQLDQALVDLAKVSGWKLQIETNGTRTIPEEFGLDWITVSPKVAEHAIRQLTAHEVKYVRGYGQALPRTRVRAERQFISPAFDGVEVGQRTLEWCKELVERSNGEWELSLQMHKVWQVR